ncbi:MAG: hypothetical protein R3C15_20720 [Thermoleophilia bacterium]
MAPVESVAPTQPDAAPRFASRRAGRLRPRWIGGMPARAFVDDRATGATLGVRHAVAAPRIAALLQAEAEGRGPHLPAPTPLVDRYAVALRSGPGQSTWLVTQRFARGVDAIAATADPELARRAAELLNRVDPYRPIRSGGGGVGWF